MFTSLKHSLMVGLMLAAGVSVAGDALISEKAADGKIELTGGAQLVELEDGTKTFKAEKIRGFTSEKTFAIDPAKSYVLSVKVKALGDTPSLAYLGVMPLDANGKYIANHNVTGVRGSMTELVAACEPDDTVLAVKDCSKWSKLPHMVIAFDVREDESDLPNFNTSSRISSTEKKGDAYEVTLTQAVGKAYPAGTKLRQHVLAGYVYAKSGAVPNEWTLWEGTLKGSQLRMGTTGKLVLLCNYGAQHKEQSMLFDELTIKEID